MLRFSNKPFGLAVRVPACVMSVLCVLGITVPVLASAAPQEIFLATAKQAMKYCQSGQMGSSDIAYISGTGGVAQYGPGANSVQQVPTGSVKLALQADGKTVSECTMVSAKEALKLCADGDIGEYNIDYIKGKPGTTLSGPGYGCVINQSTSGIGTAVCE